MLQIPSAVHAAIRSHAEESYPHECCGVLLGSRSQDAWRIYTATRMLNAEKASPHNRYRIDSSALVHLLREASRRGLEIAGFYHSHPDHPAQWSQTDLAEAHWLGCVYLITSVPGGTADQTNAFLLSGDSEEQKHFTAIPIDIDDEPISP